MVLFIMIYMLYIKRKIIKDKEEEEYEEDGDELEKVGILLH